MAMSNHVGPFYYVGEDGFEAWGFAFPSGFTILEWIPGSVPEDETKLDGHHQSLYNSVADFRSVCTGHVEWGAYPGDSPDGTADERAMTDGGEDVPEVETVILEQIRDRTEPDPDGNQDANGNVWTGRRRLRSDAVKPHTDYSKGDVDRSVTALKRRGDIVTFHGLLAPSDPDHLRAVIENERMADISRHSVISRCNRLLNAGDGGSDE